MKNNNKVLITAIIQSRLQSKRLTGKALLEIGGKPILSHIIERAQAMRGVSKVIVATCNNNEPLIKCARDMNAQVYVGSEENVLQRYCFAAREYGGDYIMRITGDNPFTDIEFGSNSALRAVETGADLFSHTALPLGSGVEVIKREALEKAYALSHTSYQKEHVTPYIKENPDKFNVIRERADIQNPFIDMRLTVDTEEDYSLAGIICSHLYKGKPFSVHEIIELFRMKPEYLKINASVIQRSMTHSES